MMKETLASSVETEKIIQVLHQYTEGWIKGDTKLLQGVWDMNYEQSTYQPVETTEIIREPRNITTYFEQTVKIFQPQSMTLDDLSIDLMGDYAYVASKCNVVIPDSNLPQTMLHPRLSFVLRHKNEQWLVIHYAESVTVKG